MAGRAPGDDPRPPRARARHVRQRPLHVRPDWPLEQTAERLRAAGELLVARAHEHHLTAGRRDTSRTPAAASDLSQPVVLAPRVSWDGHIVAREDRTFALVADGVQEPLPVPAT